MLRRVVGDLAAGRRAPGAALVEQHDAPERRDRSSGDGAAGSRRPGRRAGRRAARRPRCRRFPSAACAARRRRAVPPRRDRSRERELRCEVAGCPACRVAGVDRAPAGSAKYAVKIVLFPHNGSLPAMNDAPHAVDVPARGSRARDPRRASVAAGRFGPRPRRRERRRAPRSVERRSDGERIARNAGCGSRRSRRHGPAAARDRCPRSSPIRPPIGRTTATPWLLAPCDLQAIKASGVTFVSSMLERVIEEQTRGDPAKAESGAAVARRGDRRRSREACVPARRRRSA